jgi:hypothetical protein
MRRPLSIIACIALCALGFTAVASASTKSKSKTVSVPAGATRTIVVAYPNALRYGDAKYSGSVKVLSGKVRILSRGATQGGSAYRARVRNTGSSTASVKVTAKTTRPDSQGSQGSSGY